MSMNQYKFIIFFSLFLAISCSNSKKTSQNEKQVQSSQALLQDYMSSYNLTAFEMNKLLSSLGLTSKQFEEKIKNFSFTPEELKIFSEIIAKENNLDVRLDFVSNNSTYTPTAENELLIPCLHYEPTSGFPGKDYVLDKKAPQYMELPALRITPDELNRPKDYVFSASYADSGCGTRLLKMNCALFNSTEYYKREAWRVDIAKRKSNGEDVSNEVFPIQEKFINSGWFDCHVPNTMSSNNAEQIIYHFLNNAMENDEIILTMYPQDGAGNAGAQKGVRFVVLKELYTRVNPK